MCSSWKIYLLGITYYLLLTASVNLRRKYEQFLSYFLYGVFTHNETFCLFYMKKGSEVRYNGTKGVVNYILLVCMIELITYNQFLYQTWIWFNTSNNLAQRFWSKMIYCLVLCKYFVQFELAMPLNILLLDRPLQNIFCKPKWWKLFYPPTKRGGHT